MKYTIDKIKTIRGVEFEWDNNYISDNNLDFIPSEDEKTYGFIAQELECSVPTAVLKAPLEDVLNRNVSWEEKYKTVKSDKVIPILVEAVKEQQETIDELKCQVSQLLARCA